MLSAPEILRIAVARGAQAQQLKHMCVYVYVSIIYAGKDTSLPNGKDLPGAGMQTFETEGGQENIQAQKEQISKLLSKLEGGEPEEKTISPSPLVTIGPGLSAIPNKLVAKILVNEYIDFTELPPAKVKAGPYPSLLRGRQ
jgi:hypothetical protein